MQQSNNELPPLGDWIREHRAELRGLVKYLTNDRNHIIERIVINIDNEKMDLVNKGKVQQLTELIDILTEQ